MGTLGDAGPCTPFIGGDDPWRQWRKPRAVTLQQRFGRSAFPLGSAEDQPPSRDAPDAFP
jgi:hypothetical protein